jgi:hypothetical protein
MNLFPAVDPIPLPAPVWLFKALHVLTTALHFFALQMLIGGLLVATLLCLLAKLRGGDFRLNAAFSLTRRLPVVMTYVINLGVPPLLFAQVLYGRAIYTSSVLIGAWWIAVIPLLMLCYWLIYRFNGAVEKGRAAWWVGLSAFLVAGVIAKIYNTNMTLMLRPEIWREMYSVTATGTQLPPHDATLMPRWLFMMTGGLSFAGLWMVWLAGRPNLDGDVRAYLARFGGRLAVVAGAAQIAVALQVFGAQPAGVKAALAQPGNAFIGFALLAGPAWLGSAALMLLVGAFAGIKGTTAPLAGWLGAVAAFLEAATLALYRDGLRDATLLSKGFDVWNRSIATNWSVVGIFLLLFVAGLVVLGWLVSVMLRATPLPEKVEVLS